MKLNSADWSLVPLWSTWGVYRSHSEPDLLRSSPRLTGNKDPRCFYLFYLKEPEVKHSWELQRVWTLCSQSVVPRQDSLRFGSGRRYVTRRPATSPRSDSGKTRALVCGRSPLGAPVGPTSVSWLRVFNSQKFTAEQTVDSCVFSIQGSMWESSHFHGNKDSGNRFSAKADEVQFNRPFTPQEVFMVMKHLTFSTPLREKKRIIKRKIKSFNPRKTHDPDDRGTFHRLILTSSLYCKTETSQFPADKEQALKLIFIWFNLQILILPFCKSSCILKIFPCESFTVV